MKEIKVTGAVPMVGVAGMVPVPIPSMGHYEKVGADLVAADAVHTEKLRKLGLAVIESCGVVGERYLALCKYVRTAGPAPKLVRKVLLDLGYKNSRVSEIMRVALATESLWSQYEAKALGFDRTLSMARMENGKPKETAAMVQLVKDGVITDEDSQQALAGAKDANVGKSTKKKKGVKASIKRDTAAWLLLDLCVVAKGLALPKTWTRENLACTISELQDVPELEKG